jgi:hypothetical protein
MIIGFIGQNRVGKDTCADFFSELAHNDNINFTRLALADPIKDIARLMFNFTEDQLYGPLKDIIDPQYGIKPRDFFQKFGTEIMQFDIYNYLPQLESHIPKRSFWIQNLIKKMDRVNKETNQSSHFLITDVRGNNEASRLAEIGAILIKIIKLQSNPGHSVIPMHSTHSSHITQIEVDQILNEYITYTIINDGTLDDLKEKIKNIYEQICTNMKSK